MPILDLQPYNHFQVLSYKDRRQDNPLQQYTTLLTMMFHNGLVALLGAVFLSSESATAFAPSSLLSQTTTSTTTLRSSPPSGMPSFPSDPSLDQDLATMFPLEMPLERIEGGQTLRTYQMPIDCDRCQMYFTTNGRPLKAKVELWLGPLRRTHFMEIDVEDGEVTPFRATLKFKKGGQMLKVSGNSGLEFPMFAGVAIASSERSDHLKAITERVWDNSPKQLVQGGGIDGSLGAVRTYVIPQDVASVQVLLWARDTGKKSMKAKIEIIQGQDNRKQIYDLQCGGGSQPYHAIFQTPGGGGQVRVINKKFIEDGLFECAVVPYKYIDMDEQARLARERKWWE